MMSAEGFRARFPTLKGSTYRDILEDMPEAWRERLVAGNEAGEAHAMGRERETGREPTERQEEPEHPERVWRVAAVGWPETIPGTRPPPEKDVRELGIGGVYDRLVATMWEMPTTFRIGGDGTRIWRLSLIHI